MTVALVDSVSLFSNESANNALTFKSQAAENAQTAIYFIQKMKLNLLRIALKESGNRKR